MTKTTVTITVEHPGDMRAEMVAEQIEWALGVVLNPESTEVDQVADVLEGFSVCEVDAWEQVRSV